MHIQFNMEALVPANLNERSHVIVKYVHSHTTKQIPTWCVVAIRIIPLSYIWYECVNPSAICCTQMIWVDSWDYNFVFYVTIPVNNRESATLSGMKACSWASRLTNEHSYSRTAWLINLPDWLRELVGMLLNPEAPEGRWLLNIYSHSCNCSCAGLVPPCSGPARFLTLALALGSDSWCLTLTPAISPDHHWSDH